MSTMTTTTGADAPTIENWLRSEVAGLVGQDPRRIPSRVRFKEIGVDSLKATTIVSRLGAWLGMTLPATLLWEHPTLELLTTHLAARVQTRDRTSPDREVRRVHEEEPIAIVGIGCRFPGGATSPGAYWQLLRDGVDAVREVPRERWDAAALFDEDRTAPGKINSQRAGLIDAIDGFDPAFFGISPREAAHMDPQQRVILELAWESLEDAGIRASTLMGTSTGVFVGSMWSDYARRFDVDPTLVDQFSATGIDTSIIPARVAYTFGLQGPAIAVNTACSSSLVAVHLACISLRTGESRLAIAGGVSLITSPLSSIAMTKFGALAPDGRCKAFDARANGYVRGEGAGLVVLKPLSRAIADGNAIYAVIRSSAVNNDGFSNGLTAPNPRAQEMVLRDAYARAGIETRDVAYVETHGPGTLLGDPIEAGALGAILGEGRAPDRPLRIGSVKTNLGHTEAAAGIAGLIKVALSLRHRQLPPSLHFEQPNPLIPFESLRLRVQTELSPWPGGEQPPVAGVSSFGFGGTNCHIVLQGHRDETPQLVALAADDPVALARRARELAGRASSVTDDMSLARVCKDASGAAGAYRVAAVVRRAADLAQIPLLEPARVAAEPPRVVFVCPGQGAQWVGMGRALVRHEPAFRAALEACDRAIRPLTGWSVLERLLATRDGDDAFQRTDVVQPMLFSMQVSLGQLWRSWGVDPYAVVGFSQGEVAAAHLAGILTLDDAARIVCGRSALLAEHAPPGAMIAVALPASDPRVAAAAGDDLVIAAYSSPRATVLSGSVAAADRALARLTRDGVQAGRVQVDYASHSPSMDTLRDGLIVRLAGVSPQPVRLRMISTVTAAPLDGPECQASYWAENLRQPVRFQPVVEQLIAEGATVFIELSPHPLLGRAIDEIAASKERGVIALASGRRDEDDRLVLLDSLRELFLRGGVDRAAAPGPFVLPVSARGEAALAARCEQMAVHLEQLAAADLHDTVYSAAVLRDHHELRRAVVGHSVRELVDALRAASTRPPEVPASTEPHRVVFVFPGQGGQWRAMGQQLFAQAPVFRDAIVACAKAMRGHFAHDLVGVVTGTGTGAELDDVSVIQPAIFAVQVALAALWRSWGVAPAAVVGHSLGEVAAACVSGALSLEAAARVICVRSRLVKQASGRGTMATVELSREEAEAALAAYRGRVEVGASNGPRSTVVSGDRDAVEELISELSAQGVECRVIKVDYASHSHHMEPLKADLMRELDGLHPSRVDVPFYSTVTARWRQEPLDAAYWQSNLRERVRFWEAVQGLWADGHDTFVEINAHPILLPAIEDGLGREERRLIAVCSMKREEGLERLLHSAGSLYERGIDLDWASITGPGRRRSLPAYPWQRERAWIDSCAPASAPAQALPSGHQHAVLGTGIDSASRQGERLWQRSLELASPAFEPLRDHVVDGAALMPAAAMAALALTSAEQLFGSPHNIVADLELTRVLPLVDKTVLQMTTHALGADRATFQLASAPESTTAGGATEWSAHCAARLHKPPGNCVANGLEAVAAIEQRLEEHVEPSAFYRDLAENGYAYGPEFRRITKLRRRGGEAIAVVSPAEHRGGYVLAPAVLDGCFQVGLAAARSRANDETSGALIVPTAIARLQLYRRPQGALIAHARATWTDGGELTCDLDVRDADGHGVLTVEGLRWRSVPGTAKPEHASLTYSLAWRERASTRDASLSPGTWIVVGDESGIARALIERLEREGNTCVLIDRGQQADLAASLERVWPVAPAACRGVVHLAAVDLDEEAMPARERVRRGHVLALVQSLVGRELVGSPSLTLVTRGAQRVGSTDRAPDPSQAAVLGLGRTLITEQPGLRPRLVDLDPEASANVAAEALFDELRADGSESQVAFRDGQRRVARLAKGPATVAGGVRRARGEPYRFEIGATGSIDSVVARAAARRSPGRGEVEIAVRYAALNFRDVMKALGIYPGLRGRKTHVFDECVGTVVAVGDGVEHVSVGDEVVALAHGCGATYVTADAVLVWRKPQGMSAAEAAGVPIVWGTAALGLDHLARIRAGERVLIHSGAGAIGLAAIELARRAGAVVFATAGTEEKREFLRGRGVEHVMDSRSLSFVDDVRRITHGEGVDVVLNALSGEAIGASMGLLRQYGRFIEIGKTDIYKGNPLSLGHFQKNLMFATIDIEPVYVEKKEWYGKLIGEVLAAQGAGQMRAVPAEVHRASQLGDALRLLAQGKNVGKLVIDVDDADVRVDRSAAPIRSDGAYLITGGAGALGLETARWLVGRGARHLVLAGRSEPTAAATARIDELRAQGATIVVERVDVAKRDDVDAMLAGIRGRGVPLRGVIHAAGLLEDATLTTATMDAMDRVVRPKVSGAWNLHELTKDDPVELFVLFSSIAALFGLGGQAGYAAGNAFLDALAEARASEGLAALSINWGPWADAGLAAAAEGRGDRLAARGMANLAPRVAIRALDVLVNDGVTRAAVVALDVARWVETTPTSAQMLDELRGNDAVVAEPAQQRSLRDVLAGDSPTEAAARLEELVAGLASEVLRIPVATLPTNKPLKSLGLDSLLALELRNRLERATDLRLKTTVIWNHPTVRALAQKIGEELIGAPVATPASPAAPASGKPVASGIVTPASAPGAAPAAPAQMRAALASNSTTQLARLLKQKLANVQEKKRDE